MTNASTTADIINPTESIKKINRNILLLSLLFISVTRIVYELGSNGGSLIAPPFEYIPTNSIFTFWFSYLFLHHNVSVILFLAITLCVLILRVLFEFYFFQFPTTKIQSTNNFHFNSTLTLQKWLLTFLQQKDRDKYNRTYFRNLLYKKNRLDKILLKKISPHPPIRSVDNDLLPLCTLHQLLRYAYSRKDTSDTGKLANKVLNILEENLPISFEENYFGNERCSYKFVTIEEESLPKNIETELVELLSTLFERLPANLNARQKITRTELHTNVMFYFNSLWAAVLGGCTLIICLPIIFIFFY